MKNPADWLSVPTASVAIALFTLICGIYWIGVALVRRNREKEILVQTQPQLPTALDMVLVDIEKALQNKLFYLALVGTVTLMDMCAALESEDGKTNRGKLAAWFTQNMGSLYSYLEGMDCYGLRSGLVHQGIAKTTAQGHASKWRKIIFLLPSDFTFSNGALNDAYVTNLAEFCRDVCARVKVWRTAKSGNPIFEKNIDE